MAKNLTELDIQLSVLENKKTEQMRLLKEDINQLQESLKPRTLIKNGIQHLFSNDNTQTFLLNSGAGIIGSLLIGGKGAMIKTLLNQIITSNTVNNFIKDDKSGISKWIEKIKSFIGSKKENIPAE